MQQKQLIQAIYTNLYKLYGPRGWWPIISMADRLGFDSRGYHKGDYSYPNNERQQFEIAIGAILTQNTSWLQAEKAALNLHRSNLLSPAAIAKAKINKLADAIKPSGFFNEKAKKIKSFSKFYSALNNAVPERGELLSVWGIGPETADSILLYAYKVPTFVVDAYTRRILSALGLIDAAATYDEVKLLFERSIKPSTQKTQTTQIYQEYHALLVEHAKRYYRKGTSAHDEADLLRIISHTD